MMPVLSKSRGRSAEGPEGDARSCLIERRLPVFYMSDYSIMALLVDKLEEALGILEGSGFLVERDVCGASVEIAGPDRLKEILRLLGERNISGEVSDVMDQAYQG